MSVAVARAPKHLAIDPVGLADDLGSAYADKVSVDHRRDYGLYLTPPAVARFMGELVGAHDGVVRVLDPAAGAGILACAVVETLVRRGADRVHLVAYEVDRALARELREVVAGLRDWAASQGASVEVEIHELDFVLANADALRAMGDLFGPPPSGEFDVVVSNPPYFKLNKADARAQAALSVVHGQPNIYGLFMAIGASLLRPGGDLVFITPRSFASGPYFRAFRERFFGLVRPEQVHVFGSRRDAFARDAVLQENVILHAVRDDGWKEGEITISASAGVSDLDRRDVRNVPLREVLDLSSHDRVLRMPATLADEDLVRAVDAWTGSLAAYGWKISTGPVVPFRAREFQRTEGGADYVPLLWMNHVKPMKVSWPIARRKPEHVQDVMGSQNILVRNLNYVLMRRFSAKEEKRRLVAAPYVADRFASPRVGLENHLNYVHKPGGALTEDEAYGLAALLNSTLLDTWFRAVNGNTQVSATEIRSMPLPSLPVITKLGREVRGVTDLEEIDRMVEAAVGQR